MAWPETPANPFPGLRPFEADEDHLFFGREREVDELLRRLRFTRFLAVVGTSGCGKSSLIRSGLIPALQGGFMSRAGSSWRIAILRPGEDPTEHLAAALASPDVLGTDDPNLAATSRMLLDASLRRSTLGLVDAVRHARIPAHDNVLVVVDQFEELFRFQRNRSIEQARTEAVSFVSLLLEASAQTAVPIFVVLTMRSDFIGDCMEYPGLPEALNASQYLVPRLTRDELRAAITGPVAVAGAEIAPRLVLRLLNDLGQDQDQLPVLQHALMRTWDRWAARGGTGPIDIADYEAVGTLRHALSRHAEEAYADTGSDRARTITEGIFKALTDTVTDPRGVRRPSSIRELAAITEATDAEVIHVVETFRRPGRSFLMPPASTPLDARVIVDLSHESLMRGWSRLIGWAEQERAAAATYLRLTTAARWHAEGSAGLWRDPELEIGLRWRRETRPTRAWGRRYDDSFDEAMRFLDRSEQERDRERTERTAARRRQWRQLQFTALVLAASLVYAIWNGLAAGRARAQAEQSLEDARRAVDESLALVDRGPASLAIDHPEIIEFRRDLARKAQEFYAEFIKRDPSREDLQESIAAAHARLGKIHLILDDPANAVREYRQAIDEFERLAAVHPGHAPYLQELANAYNWLGEALRPARDQFQAAREAYDRAIAIEEELARGDPDSTLYKQALARTRSNRGILHADAPSEAGAALAETDLVAAITLLEPLADERFDPGLSQELARASNNLGSLRGRTDRLETALPLHERAVAIHEALVQAQPENREYRLELAKFHNNLADTLRRAEDAEGARRHNTRALELLDELARPAPSLAIEQADTHSVRGWILESQSLRDAADEYRTALGLYQRLVGDQLAWRLPEFHRRFGDLLKNLSYLARQPETAREGRALLVSGLQTYHAAADRVLRFAGKPEAGFALETIARIGDAVSTAGSQDLTTSYGELERELREVLMRQ